MGPKRIAYVDHALQLGGAQKSLLELLARLDRRRFSPVLLCAEGAEWLHRPELDGIEQVPVFEASALLEQRRDQLDPSVLGSRRQLLGGLTLVLRLRRALRAVKADLVHTNTLKAHFLGGAAGRLSGLPVLWHVRDILDPGPARTWLLRASKLLRPQVIAISQAVAAQFSSQNVPVELIYNGIPLDQFTPEEPDPSLKRELQLSPEEEVLVIVGRLTPWKGHRTLLEALAILSTQRPQVRLLVVGEVAFWEASYGEELERLAEDLGVADRVSWLGFREDVPAILRLCDLFVLPSEDEPFGRVLIEAMAVGKPVVATRSGGAPEVVVDGETGALVPPGDEKSLAAALGDLLSDRSKAAALGQGGLERARAVFDVNRVVEMVQSLYDRTLAGRRTG